MVTTFRWLTPHARCQLVSLCALLRCMELRLHSCLTSALDGSGKLHTSAVLSLVPIEYESGWIPDPFWGFGVDDDDNSQHAKYEGIWGSESTDSLIPYLSVTRNDQSALNPCRFTPTEQSLTTVEHKTWWTPGSVWILCRQDSYTCWESNYIHRLSFP